MWLEARTKFGLGEAARKYTPSIRKVGNGEAGGGAKRETRQEAREGGIRNVQIRIHHPHDVHKHDIST